ncbi:unnamed protein product [Bubo scandiacus]
MAALAGGASRSPGPSSAPRRDHKMEDAAAAAGRRRRRSGARARRRDAAPRSPESAALGRAAGATRSAASLGAVAERKSRSRLRREPALKGGGTGKPTRCSARAHAANRSPVCEPGSASPCPGSQSEQSAPPRGRAQAGHKLDGVIAITMTSSSRRVTDEEGKEERGLLVLYLAKRVCCWQVLGALTQSENVSSPYKNLI